MELEKLEKILKWDILLIQKNTNYIEVGILSDGEVYSDEIALIEIEKEDIDELKKYYFIFETKRINGHKYLISIKPTAKIFIYPDAASLKTVDIRVNDPRYIASSFYRNLGIKLRHVASVSMKDAEKLPQFDNVQFAKYLKSNIFPKKLFNKFKETLNNEELLLLEVDE